MIEVGTKVDDKSKDSYLNIMHQIIDVRGGDYSKFEKWLTSTDFFKAPGSTRFHDSYEGGLLDHHFNVYNEMCDLRKLDKFKNVDVHSSSLVALTHDYCKIGLYDSYMKNVKNDNTGQWGKVQAYKYDKPQFPLGHGITSMYIVNKLIPLDIEESLAIRWHMGEYNCCQGEMSDLQEARDRYPLVLMLQIADRMAITSY